jgi:hypothetical protein
MLFRFVRLIAAMMLWLIPTAAESYVFRGRPNCPEYSPTHNWADYMQGKYGDPARPFSIKFDHLKAPLGSLAPNTCYTVTYIGGQWTTTGRDDSGRTSRPPGYGGADPGQLLMNIRGRIMKFNQFGQVIDDQFGVIGSLKCGIGPDC